MADIFNLTDTWNDAGTTFTAVKMNVTDTASQAASLLLDLQVAGSSKASITKAGAMTLAGALTYGGVTLANAVTGTGNMVLSASPTFTGTVSAAAITATGAVATGALTVTGTATVVSGSGLTVRNAAADGFNLIQFNTNSWRLDGLSASSVLDFGSNTATITITGTVTVANSIKSSHATAGVGYATGAGGAVTQITSRTTGVTINKASGAITLVSAAGSTSIAAFTVTNSAVEATDTIYVCQKSGTDKYRIYVTAVAAGSFQISFATLSGTTTEQPVFNFAVIKAAAA